jgi:hypothetical protein
LARDLDLLQRYSNRPDLLTRLKDVCEMVGEQGCYDHLTPTLTVAARSVKPRRVRDRLTDDEVQALIADYLAGTFLRVLAKRYGLGLTAVKDLLRRHGVRRTP